MLAWDGVGLEGQFLHPQYAASRLACDPNKLTTITSPGKRVVLVHASLHHLNTRPASFPAPKTDSTPAPTPIAADPEVLRPFKHPDYRYLTYINPRNVKATLDPRKLSGLANMVGMQGVMRWKPAHVGLALFFMVFSRWDGS